MSATEDPTASKTNLGAKMAHTMRWRRWSAAQSVAEATATARKKAILRDKRDATRLNSSRVFFRAVNAAKRGTAAARRTSPLQVSKPRRNPMT